MILATALMSALGRKQTLALSIWADSGSSLLAEREPTLSAYAALRPCNLMLYAGLRGY